jgi:hypothetical protein
MAKETNERALRVTDQQRSKTGMTYDLKGDGARLTVLVSPRALPDDPDEWRVQVSTRDVPTEEVFDGWGPTKADALAAAGRRWNERALHQNLPPFDWASVATVLGKVRAV